MIQYKIFAAKDKEGNKKELPKDWTDGRYIIYSATAGRSALLMDVNDKSSIQTSTVEEIFIFDNGIRIETLNTVYYLKPEPQTS